MFSHAYWPSVLLPWRNVDLSFLPIFWLACFIIELYELFVYFGNKPLVVSVANVLFSFVCCLFVLFLVSFAVKKLVSLIMSNLFSFAFISVALGGQPKEMLLLFMSENILPVFPSRSLMMSCLLFMSLIHFELIFCMVWEYSNFIDLHVTVRLSQHHLLKKLFSIVYPCLLCHRLIDCRCVGLFLGSLFCSADPYVCFCANATLFWLVLSL